MIAWPIAPMKAVLGKQPVGDDWRYEPKWDGHRALIRRRGDDVDIVSSTGKRRNDNWPWLVDTARAVAAADDEVIIDGEVIAYDDSGRHRFELVGRPDRRHAFVAFDLLAVDGRSLLRQPWSTRRDLLVDRVAASADLQITPVSDDAELMAAVTAEQRFEGLVAKRATSIYQPGKRSTSWVKVKYRSAQEMVVGGYKAGTGARAATFGSLLVGVYDNGELRFAGAVGTGFDEPTLWTLRRTLDDLATDERPFAEPVVLPGRPQLHWVRPELVVQVAFHEWTHHGGIRAPVFEGVRTDKRPTDVVREIEVR